MEQRDSVGDAYLRIEVQENPSPGLADEIREAFPNAVDVRVVHDAGEQDEGERLDLTKISRSPRRLFSQYLKEKEIENEDLLKLFDELVEEVHATHTA